MSRRPRLAVLASLLLVALGVSVGAVVSTQTGGSARASRCTPSRAGADPDARASTRAATSGLQAMYRGGSPTMRPACDEPGLPESYADLALANSSRASRDVAPGTQIKPGAARAALRQKDAMDATKGSWQPFGRSPLETGRTEYDTSNGSTNEGLGNVSGRANVITYDPASGRLFEGATEGGVFTSTDGGATWTSIGDPLATQAMSGLAWTSANGGTLLALTGDNSFGGGTSSGLGAYYTNDLGKTWNHATGIPDGLLAFRLVVDPNNANIVYAATGGGLFRSTDGGHSYVNVDLPTGKGQTPDCSGQPVTVKDCFLANMVTDVVVQGPANSQTPGGKPGAVLAAVGWRAGTKPNADGSIESPGNGLYRSDSGAPGSFANVDFAGNAIPTTDPLTQARIGRTALGIANGPTQNHQVVYAIVQDAVKFNGGVVGLDANENGLTTAAQSDYLNGIWASTDFGSTWHELEGSTTIDNDTTSGSALAPPTCKAPAVIGYCPGIQAWYNLHVAPDPTQQTATGTPTRLVFGLEELWEMSDSGGLSTSPEKADVVGRYFAGKTCTLLNATNGLPVCPAAQGGQVPPTTTHPDQHAVLWVPNGNGGVTLFAGNDGGVYSQSVPSGGDLSNTNWGQGSNSGLNTLQPYDVALAKDGTAYYGMQDNGEGKTDPDGRSYTVFGGDGFFTAVDPDNSNVAYEEYTAGAVSATADGGKTWTSIDPTLINPQFSTPFEMDPADANHIVIAGCDVRETTAGPQTAPGTGTADNSWKDVYELGTQDQPGSSCSPSPVSSAIVNQASAVDVRSQPTAVNAPTGPKTADFSYTGGGSTFPGLGDQTGSGVFVPGTYDDHKFTVGPNDGDRSVTIDVTWGSSVDDWDLYVYKVAQDGSMTQVGSSASAMTTEEKVTIPNPSAGNYVIRVDNFTAVGTFDAKVTFEQRTSSAASSAAGAPSFTYIGWCGYCDTITQGTPFNSGVATNVGGDKPGKAGTSDGWHIAKANGLPKRLITSIRMDPTDPSTVYVTLAGYARKWAEPGAVGDDTSKVGTGHMFKSTDAGQTFTNISGNLPDTPADWSVIKDGHLIVGTDLGVYVSDNTDGGNYQVLGTNLPNVQVSTLQFSPSNPNLLVAATYGRGLWSFDFTCHPVDAAAAVPANCLKAVSSSSGAVACASSAGFKSVKVRPKGHGLRFDVVRNVKRPFTVDVFRESAGRRVITERKVATFKNRTKSFTWSGKGRKAVGNGIYFARVRMKAGVLDDARRPTFTRSHGRFHPRPGFFALAKCKLLRRARLLRPTFGGKTNVPLRISARLTGAGSVTFVVKRGKHTIKRRTIAHAKAAHTYRLAISPRRLRRGDYKVTVTAKSGKSTEVARLTGRRL